jgi:sugar/nucleoside kinase (ribokinase family)
MKRVSRAAPGGIRLVGRSQHESGDLSARFATAAPAPVILGIGLISLDVVFGMDRRCGPQLTAGGTCGNVLTALSLFGWRSYPVSRLANDPAGAHVRNDLRHWGLHLDYVEMGPPAPSPIIVQRIKTDATGSVVHRFSISCPSCGKVLPQYSPVSRQCVLALEDKLPNPATLFVDRLSPGAVNLAERVHESGGLIYFEPSSLLGRHLLNRMLDVTHVLKYSQDMALRFPDLRQRTPFVPLEVETLGARGLRYRTTLLGRRGRTWRKVGPFQVAELRDASGAGDWCSAGVIHALGQVGAAGLKHVSRTRIEESLLFGQALAAWNCAFEGARGGMYLMKPSEVRAQISELLQQRRVSRTPSPNYCILPIDVFGELCKTCEQADVGPLGKRAAREGSEKPRRRARTA